jgi:hypothetical protein
MSLVSLLFVAEESSAEYPDYAEKMKAAAPRKALLIE